VVFDRGCQEADVEGTSFGRYRLIGLLGRGGMGEVWRAHDTETDRIVAIKLLPAAVCADEEFQQRFRREARAAARLNNPHVIPIHHYGEIDGQLYVDMRLVEGKASKRCSPTDRWNLRGQCASSNKSPEPCTPPTRLV
jgi:serine/threonine-protein kinase